MQSTTIDLTFSFSRSSVGSRMYPFSAHSLSLRASSLLDAAAVVELGSAPDRASSPSDQR